VTRQLIDISSWQHPNGQPIDWQAVAGAGVWGVIVKATQGAAYVNPWFAGDVEGARSAGLATGAYHFAEPGGASAPDQAGHHLRTVGALDLPLGLWLDLEITQGRQVHEVIAWRNEFFQVTSQTGRPGGLYVPVDLADKMVDLHEMPFLWLANPSGLDHNYMPAIIQTGQTEVPGIPGQTDVDTLISDRWVNIPQQAPPPAPEPEPEPAPTSQGGTAILREGDGGPAVEGVQRLLLSWGAYIAVDGDFGPQTDNAVRSLQRHALITVDGVVGPGTWIQLLRFDAAETAWPPPDRMPQIERGSHGRAVTACQVAINATGMLIACDGVFGPETERAVRVFQTERHLQVDGIVGPHTWGALV
jgi:peptidoglycan hydrolase-like protein with peptidoglycan-binding domain